MKALKLFALAGIVASSSAMATTYSTIVQISDLVTSLEWSEATKMQFPRLVLDARTVAGHTCVTNTNSSGSNQLCPDSSGKAAAVFTVNGTAFGEVGINLDDTPKVIEGIEFRPSSGTFVTLNSAGTANVGVQGVLTLQDRTAIQSDSITFTYDLEFTGQ